MTDNPLEALLKQYTELRSTGRDDPDFDQKARRLRKKIRDAGGSVTSLGDGSDRAATPRAPREPKPPRERKARGSDVHIPVDLDSRGPLHRTSSRGSSAPKYRQPTKGTPPSDEQVAAVIADLSHLQEIPYRDLAKRNGNPGFGLGFLVYADTPASMFLDRFSARYPGIKPEWFSLSRPASAGGSFLLVLGPVPNVHDAQPSVDLGDDDDDGDGGEGVPSDSDDLTDDLFND